MEQRWGPVLQEMGITWKILPVFGGDPAMQFEVGDETFQISDGEDEQRIFTLTLKGQVQICLPWARVLKIINGLHELSGPAKIVVEVDEKKDRVENADVMVQIFTLGALAEKATLMFAMKQARETLASFMDRVMSEGPFGPTLADA